MRVLLALLVVLMVPPALADLLPADYGSADAPRYGGVIQPDGRQGPVRTTIEFREGTVGGNADRGTVVASFPLADLPGLGAWIVTVDITGQEFTINTLDFGYSYHYDIGGGVFEGVEGGGPMIRFGGLGNENQFYGDGPPDWPGWYWFGGEPWAGFYMKMWDTAGNVVYDNTADTGFYFAGPALDWGDMAEYPVTIGQFEIGYVTEAVPEPASLGLLALGVLALARRR
ncbi:MAG: PEP-CTERM sorting domain-containing protein [Phycisphaerae bacterium]